MRIAICTMAAPWPARPTLSLYNAHQAAALTEIGAPTQLTAVVPYVPRALAKVAPRFKDHAERPLRYEFAGASIRIVRTVYGSPRFFRMKLSPRAPWLTARIMTLSIGRRLDRALAEFRPDVLLFHNGFLWGDAARKVSRRLGVPYAIIEHDVLPSDPNSPQGRYYRAIAADARKIFVVGRNLLSQARDDLGLSQAMFVSNGAQLPTDAQRAAPRPEKWNGQKLVLCVGSFIERKGHAQLLEAFAAANVPGARLLIVGAPSAPIRELIENLALGDRVEIIPAMVQQELLQYMVWADVFALPSWDEPWGLVYAEAMGAETPVILTSSCGMASEVTHGVHGWIVPPRSVPELTDALRAALLSADLKQMGRAGRGLVEGRLTWRKNAEAVLAALRESGVPERA